MFLFKVVSNTYFFVMDKNCKLTEKVVSKPILGKRVIM